MGMFGHKHHSYSTPSPVLWTQGPPNPDPKNFHFIKHREIGKYLVVLINYPNCTNFEGNKIVVYQGIRLISLILQKTVDPHFDKSAEISPIARFIPTDDGWGMAVLLAETMDTLDKKNRKDEILAANLARKANYDRKRLDGPA